MKLTISLTEVMLYFGKPLELSKLVKHSHQTPDHFRKMTSHFRKFGIYFICKKKQSINNLDFLNENIIYIGKASGETILSRCRKHFYSLIDIKTANGNPRTKPGKAFRNYRESINHNPKGHWAYPILINYKGQEVNRTNFPYLISMLEEYYIHEFNKKNKRAPVCNTKIN